MKAEPKSNGSTPAADPDTYITVLISPVMEREFKRRDIFPELRLETAVRIQNGATGVHKVSVERAKELLADAQAMGMYDRAAPLPRGIPVAYSALVRNIGATLKQEARRGLWDDPGMDEMKKRAAQSPARFDVGDTALYFDDDDEEYGTQVSVVEAYGLYAVLNEAGAYLSAANGKRINYQSGYVVKRKGAENTFFVLACQLTRDDCQPSHLRLVASMASAAAHSD